MKHYQAIQNAVISGDQNAGRMWDDNAPDVGKPVFMPDGGKIVLGTNEQAAAVAMILNSLLKATGENHAILCLATDHSSLNVGIRCVTGSLLGDLAFELSKVAEDLAAKHQINKTNYMMASKNGVLS